VVQVSGWYKDRPLYRVADIEALADDPGHVGVLAGIVAERQAWLAGSLEGYQAATCLGWSAQGSTVTLTTPVRALSSVICDPGGRRVKGDRW
jgi:hypothetical protein